MSRYRDENEIQAVFERVLLKGIEAIAPRRLAFQPEPVVTMLGTLDSVTAITRTWAPGDARRCRLCPDCAVSSDGKVCTVLTNEPVSETDAPTYSITMLD